MFRKVKKNFIQYFIIIITCFWLLPIVILFITSLRPGNLVRITGWWEVFKDFSQLTFANYKYVFQKINLGKYLLNTFKISIPSSLFITFLSSFTSYALSFYRYKFTQIIYRVFIIILILPIYITFIPVLKIFNILNLSGTYFSIWLAHTAYALPFSIIFIKTSFDSMPYEIIEQAYMDGISDLQIFLFIVLPIFKTTIISLFAIQFILVWNDLLIALIFLGLDINVSPLTVKISQLVSTHGSGWEYLTPSAFISSFIPIVVFYIFQRIFIKKYYLNIFQ